MAKNLVLDSILAPSGCQFGPPNFFCKNLALSVTRYHGQLSPCTIPEKTNDPVLRKLGDGQTGQTDEQKDRRMRVIS